MPEDNVTHIYTRVLRCDTCQTSFFKIVRKAEEGSHWMIFCDTCKKTLSGLGIRELTLKEQDNER